jgi:hypothetical protein
VPEYSEELILALTSGAVAVFPGQVVSDRPRALVVSQNLEAPLCAGFDPVLVAFTKRLAAPPPGILAASVEVVIVLEDAGSPAFRAALHQTVRKWRPEVARLEAPQMAQYAADCAPARATLVHRAAT